MKDYCSLQFRGLTCVWIIVCVLGTRDVGCLAQGPTPDEGVRCVPGQDGMLDNLALDMVIKWMPDELKNPDAICVAQLGSGSSLCREMYNGNYTGICGGMWCREPFLGTCTLVPANDGVQCGDQKWCSGRECRFSEQATPVSESCPFGDSSLFLLDGLTCRDVVPRDRRMCYDDTVEQMCCQSCLDVSFMNRQGCRYGDSTDGCQQENCLLMTVDQLQTCCQTCGFFIDIVPTQLATLDTPGPLRTNDSNWTSESAGSTTTVSVANTPRTTGTLGPRETTSVTLTQSPQTTRMGQQTTTTARQITMSGTQTTVTGTQTTVSGTQTTVNGAQTTVSGTQTTNGQQTTGTGTTQKNSKTETTVSGTQTTASGTQTTINGGQTTVSSTQTTVSGAQTTVNGAQTTVSGTQTTNGQQTTGTGTTQENSNTETTQTIQPQTTPESTTRSNTQQPRTQTSTAPTQTTTATDTVTTSTQTSQVPTSTTASVGTSSGQTTPTAQQTNVTTSEQRTTNIAQGTETTSQTQAPVNNAGAADAQTSDAVTIGAGVGAGAAVILVVVIIIVIIVRTRVVTSGMRGDGDNGSVGGDSFSHLIADMAGSRTTWYPNYRISHTME